jgi:hypothetical protein
MLRGSSDGDRPACHLLAVSRTRAAWSWPKVMATLRNTAITLRVWDGRHADGSPPASGVYFAKLRTAGETTSARLAKIGR